MHDIIIVGGSYAGISAGLQLARARRDVLVLDAGQRRNRAAAASHGFLGQDGADPGAIAAKGRAELLAYPTVTWRDAAVVDARAVPGAFAVRAGADEHRGRRLVLATGVVDELPAIPGLGERWGRTVFHCPYCHGYELGRGPLAVLATGPLSLHQAVLVSDWASPGGTTLLLSGALELDTAQRDDLTARGIHVERVPVVEVAGEGPEIDVRLEDARRLHFHGLFLQPRTRPALALAASLGWPSTTARSAPSSAPTRRRRPPSEACSPVATWRAAWARWRSRSATARGPEWRPTSRSSSAPRSDVARRM